MNFSHKTSEVPSDPLSDKSELCLKTIMQNIGIIKRSLQLLSNDVTIKTEQMKGLYGGLCMKCAGHL